MSLYAHFVHFGNGFSYRSNIRNLQIKTFTISSGVKLMCEMQSFHERDARSKVCLLLIPSSFRHYFGWQYQ